MKRFLYIITALCMLGALPAYSAVSPPVTPQGQKKAVNSETSRVSSKELEGAFSVFLDAVKLYDFEGEPSPGTADAVKVEAKKGFRDSVRTSLIVFYKTCENIAPLLKVESRQKMFLAVLKSVDENIDRLEVHVLAKHTIEIIGIIDELLQAACVFKHQGNSQPLKDILNDLMKKLEELDSACELTSEDSFTKCLGQVFSPEKYSQEQLNNVSLSPIFEQEDSTAQEEGSPEGSPPTSFVDLMVKMGKEKQIEQSFVDSAVKASRENWGVEEYSESSSTRLSSDSAMPVRRTLFSYGKEAADLLSQVTDSSEIQERRSTEVICLLELELAELMDELMGLMRVSKQQELQIDLRDKRIVDLEKKIKDLRLLLKEQQGLSGRHINASYELEQKFLKLESEFTDFRGQVAELQAEIQRQESLNAKQKAKIRSKKNKIRKQKRQIRDLKQTNFLFKGFTVAVLAVTSYFAVKKMGPALSSTVQKAGSGIGSVIGSVIGSIFSGLSRTVYQAVRK